MKSGNFNFNSRASIFTICLLIAILFWFFTALNKLFIKTVSIPLIYKNIPLSFQLDKPLPSKVRVDIEGKGFDLMSDDFIENNKSLTIDFNSPAFRNMDLKSHTSIATENLLHFISVNDPSYRIVKILPDSIVMDYSKKFTLKVPVKLSGELNFKKQFFSYLSPMIKPDSIEIAGPQELVKKITFLETQKVIYNNIGKNLFFSAHIINPFNDKIILSEKKVWVLVPVEEFTEEKAVLPIRKIYYHNKPVTLIPDKITITYHTSLKNFSLIGENDFEAGIDQYIRSIDNNENKLPVKIIKFPKSAQIVSVMPEFVDYLIEK